MMIIGLMGKREERKKNFFFSKKKIMKKWKTKMDTKKMILQNASGKHLFFFVNIPFSDFNKNFHHTTPNIFFLSIINLVGQISNCFFLNIFPSLLHFLNKKKKKKLLH